MANNITVGSIRKLIEDGGSMQEYAAGFRKEYNTIYDAVAKLEQEWHGESSKRYLNDINSFKADLDTFITKLDQFGQLYEGIGKAYEKAEQEL
ncbi:MAG: WXG100 family type VII secretion target [Bacilli bacterium]|nr:WXG100 family type VII secretion target [Bacilli bacterium]